MEDLSEKYQKLLEELEQIRLLLHRKEVELKAVLAQVPEISNTDMLTYLPNRRKIVGDLQREVLRSNRYRTPVSISILDIDHFKAVNDTYGHAAGDEALRCLANELRDGIRDPDSAGRLGGDEFLIVLPNTSIAAASGQAERLCRKVRSLSVPIDGQELSIMISIGVVEYLTGSENWEGCMKRADAALYQAKRNGGNQWFAAKD